MPVVPLEQLDPQNKIEYRRVLVSGKFDSSHQVLLDNQVHQTRAGYHIVTPLKIAGSDRAILVNRGWVDGKRQRDNLPQFDTPQEQVEVTGGLKHPGGVGLKLGEHSYTKESWPLVVQWLDIDELKTQTGYDLYPYVLRLGKQEPYGFVREWKIVSSSPEQSTSYAVQWFTLAFVLLVIYVFVNSRKTDHGKHEYK